jgi:riboflavin kinase / FMN adenylyltransferase
VNPVVVWEKGARPLGGAVVAIGVFDGVHLGHQALIEEAALDARARGLLCVALTFDRDPEQVVSPDLPSAQLLTLADKTRYLLEAGADRVLVVPFDATLATLSPERFFGLVVFEAVTPIAVHVGVDFRFGHFAQGDVPTLETLGDRHGFEVSAHDLVAVDGAPVTSTRIRGCIDRGDIGGAALLLGRPHRVSGLVARGRGAGARELGIPTANLQPVEHAALPPDGVYAGAVVIDDLRHPAAISVGIPPTFPHAHHRLEAHLLDVEADLYGATATLEFVESLREQRRFASTEELAAAIRSDIASARVALARSNATPSTE